MINAKPGNCKKYNLLRKNKGNEASVPEKTVDIYKEDKEKSKKEIIDLLKKEFSVKEIIELNGIEEVREEATQTIMNNYNHNENIVIANACLKHKDNDYCINYKYLVLAKENVQIIYVLYKNLEKAVSDYTTKQTLIPNLLYGIDILKSNIDNQTYKVLTRAINLKVDTFEINDIKLSMFKEKDIDKYLPLYDDLRNEELEKEKCYSRKCKKCEFRDYCGVPKLSIADLESTPNCWRILDPIIKENKSLDLETLTEEQIAKLTPRQYARYMAWKSEDGIYIDKEIIQSFLDIIKNGYISFDFETYSSMKPFNEKYSNYSQIPFSFSSDLVDCNDKVIEHQDYIVDYQEINFDSVIEQMLMKVPVDLPLVVYFKTFELSRLKEFQKLYPDFSNIIQSWIDNVVDLYEVFDKGGYYDVRFDNSISLKNVYPVLCDSNQYSNLNINKGDEAALEYKAIFNNKKKTKKADKIINELQEYNALDTMAQVDIIKKLKEIVK